MRQYNFPLVRSAFELLIDSDNKIIMYFNCDNFILYGFLLITAMSFKSYIVISLPDCTPVNCNSK